MSYQGQTDSDLDNLIMIDTNQDLQCYMLQTVSLFFVVVTIYYGLKGRHLMAVTAWLAYIVLRLKLALLPYSSNV